MPSGQHRKPSDNSKFIKIGWDDKRYTKFDYGIRETCAWFKQAYPHVRGIL